jgi:hypothetical protein
MNKLDYDKKFNEYCVNILKKRFDNSLTETVQLEATLMIANENIEELQKEIKQLKEHKELLEKKIGEMVANNAKASITARAIQKNKKTVSDKKTKEQKE